MIGPTTVPWVWAIAALFLAFIELNAPGYYLIWIACAAALTSAVLFNVDLALKGQIILFGLSSVVTCVGGHFVYRRWLLPSEHDSANVKINRPDADMIGAIGTASESFHSGIGKIRLGDTYWLAESTEEIGKDVRVIVRAVNGTSLVVAAYK